MSPPSYELLNEAPVEEQHQQVASSSSLPSQQSQGPHLPQQPGLVVDIPQPPHIPQDAHDAVAETSGAFLVVYSLCVGAMFTSTAMVCTFHWGDCSAPLEYWSVVHVLRHVAKAILFAQKMRCHRSSEGRVPRALMMKIRALELVGVAWWITGLYWLCMTRDCARPVLSLALTLFLIQTFFLLMPALVFLLVLCCLPMLLWIIPYMVPPNPNQLATAEGMIDQIKCEKYEDALPKLTKPVEPTCAICLGDFDMTEEVMLMPCDPSRHVFHTECATSWLRQSQLCPICRSNIPALLSGEDTMAAPMQLTPNEGSPAAPNHGAPLASRPRAEADRASPLLDTGDDLEQCRLMEGSLRV
eukprot:gnl/MRDRNA2_/MRDRNA2_173223_c0_seq1.p1 gnl/MRDRNA2_/MRDRNA2_173223_c0~~gnl/MRDRNA2_/MRDRNA2_173223_c0_seq1.p1  ORF type:complete len:356 (-),score=41.49 gnl/MRDRNA2_/MRDRNA2_173223_c0_seq1:62-1129(-)